MAISKLDKIMFKYQTKQQDIKVNDIIQVWSTSNKAVLTYQIILVAPNIIFDIWSKYYKRGSRSDWVYARNIDTQETALINLNEERSQRLWIKLSSEDNGDNDPLLNLMSVKGFSLSNEERDSEGNLFIFKIKLHNKQMETNTMVESCLEHEIINLSPLLLHPKVESALRNPEHIRYKSFVINRFIEKLNFILSDANDAIFQHDIWESLYFEIVSVKYYLSNTNAELGFNSGQEIETMNALQGFLHSLVLNFNQKTSSLLMKIIRARRDNLEVDSISVAGISETDYNRRLLSQIQEGGNVIERLSRLSISQLITEAIKNANMVFQRSRLHEKYRASRRLSEKKGMTTRQNVDNSEKSCNDELMMICEINKIEGDVLTIHEILEMIERRFESDTMSIDSTLTEANSNLSDRVIELTTKLQSYEEDRAALDDLRETNSELNQMLEKLKVEYDQFKLNPQFQDQYIQQMKDSVVNLEERIKKINEELINERVNYESKIRSKQEEVDRLNKENTESMKVFTQELQTKDIEIQRLRKDLDLLLSSDKENIDPDLASLIDRKNEDSWSLRQCEEQKKRLEQRLLEKDSIISDQLDQLNEQKEEMIELKTNLLKSDSSKSIFESKLLNRDQTIEMMKVQHLKDIKKAKDEVIDQYQKELDQLKASNVSLVKLNEEFVKRKTPKVDDISSDYYAELIETKKKVNDLIKELNIAKLQVLHKEDLRKRSESAKSSFQQIAASHSLTVNELKKQLKEQEDTIDSLNSSKDSLKEEEIRLTNLLTESVARETLLEEKVDSMQQDLANLTIESKNSSTNNNSPTLDTSNDLDHEINDLRDREQLLLSTNENLQERLQFLTNQLIQRAQTISDLQSREIDSSERQRLEERIQDLKDINQSYHDTLVQMTEENKNYSDDIENKTSQITELNQRLTSCRETEESSRSEIQRLEAMLKSYKENSSTKLVSTSQQTAQAPFDDRTQQTIDDLNETIKFLKTSNRVYKEIIENNPTHNQGDLLLEQHKNEQANREISQKDSEISQLNASLVEKEEKINRLQSNLTKAKERLKKHKEAKMKRREADDKDSDHQSQVGVEPSSSDPVDRSLPTTDQNVDEISLNVRGSGSGVLPSSDNLVDRLDSEEEITYEEEISLVTNGTGYGVLPSSGRSFELEITPEEEISLITVGTGYGILPSSGRPSGRLHSISSVSSSDDDDSDDNGNNRGRIPPGPGMNGQNVNSDNTANMRKKQLETLAEISRMQVRVDRYKEMIKSEEQVSRFSDEELRSFKDYDSITKHGVKYRDIIKDLQTSHENLTSYKVWPLDDPSKQSLEQAITVVDTCLKDINKTVQRLHDKAKTQNILQGVKALDISEKAIAPVFTGQGVFPNHFYEFKKKFLAYCRTTQVSFDASSTLLMKCLTKKALASVKLKFTSNNNPPAGEVMDYLKEQFGEPQFIIKQIQQAHIEACKIEDLTTQKYTQIYSRSLHHLDLMNKTSDILKDYPNSLQNTYYSETILSLFPSEERNPVMLSIQAVTSDKLKYDIVKEALNRIVQNAHKQGQLNEAVSGFIRPSNSRANHDEDTFISLSYNAGVNSNYDLRKRQNNKNSKEGFKANQDRSNSNKNKKDSGKGAADSRNENSIPKKPNNQGQRNEVRDNHQKKDDNRQENQKLNRTEKPKSHDKDNRLNSAGKKKPPEYYLIMFRDDERECKLCQFGHEKGIALPKDNLHTTNNRGNIEIDSCPLVRHKSVQEREKFYDDIGWCKVCTYRPIMKGHDYILCDHTTRYNYTKCLDEGCKTKRFNCGKHREKNLGELKKRADLFKAAGVTYNYLGDIYSSLGPNTQCFVSSDVVEVNKSIEDLDSLPQLYDKIGKDRIEQENKGAPNFIFQIMEGKNGEPVIASFDSASHRCIVTASAVGRSIYAASIQNEEQRYTTVTGMGGSVLLENCRIAIPLCNGKYKMAVAHIKNELFRTGPIDLTESVERTKLLISESDKLENSDINQPRPYSTVSLLIGINEANIQPILVHLFDDGLAVYKSIIRSPFSKNKPFTYCLGGSIQCLDTTIKNHGENFLSKIMFNMNISPHPGKDLMYMTNHCTPESINEDSEISRNNDIEYQENYSIKYHDLSEVQKYCLNHLSLDDNTEYSFFNEPSSSESDEMVGLTSMEKKELD